MSLRIPANAPAPRISHGESARPVAPEQPSVAAQQRSKQPAPLSLSASGVEAQPAGRHIALAPKGGHAAQASKLDPHSTPATHDELSTRRALTRAGAKEGSAPVAASGGTPLKEALAKHDVAAAGGALRGMSAGEQLAALQGLDTAKFNSVVDGVRSGKITDEKTIAAVNIETLARTKWARTHGELVDNLRDKFVDGKVTYTDNPDGKGTKNVNAFTNKDGDVRLNRELLKHPELAAATLANESVHSHAATHGTKDNYLTEEARSSVADAEVWMAVRSRVPDKNTAAYKSQDATAKVYEKHGEAGVVAATAAHYANSLPDKGQREKILSGLSGNKKAQQALTPSQGEALANAAYKIATEGRKPATTKDELEANKQAVRDQVFNLAIAMRHAPPAVVKATEDQLKGLAKDSPDVVDHFRGTLEMARKNQP